MKERLSRWLSRAIFFAAVLSLLATSKPKEWSLAAVISGPATPSAGRGLEVTIDASSEPRLHATGVAPSRSGYGDTPCLSSWSSGTKLSCFLPPGATLTSVDIEGSCGNCSSSSCSPPPGSSIKVTTAEVAAWSETVTSRLKATLPDHGKDRVATLFKVLASGAGFTRVTLTATPIGGGPALLHEEQACRLDLGSKPPAAYCSFLIYDTDVKGTTDVEVVAEVTGWGTCGGAACAAPKTLRIDTLEIAK